VSDAWHSAGTPDAAGVVRAAERLADRLRLLGPRWAARNRSEDAVPAAAVRAGLQQLAEVAARAEAEPARPVPDLGLHAFADQLLVLARDAAAAGTPEALAEADAVLATLRAAL
jgi:hypothetical protein